MKAGATLPPQVGERLIAEREAAFDRLHALLDERGDGTFTPDAERQVFRVIRRIGSIDAARRGRGFSALTADEMAWLRAQGVAVDLT